MKPQWKCYIKGLELSKLWTSTKEVIKIQGVNLLVAQMGDLQARIYFWVSESLAVCVILTAMNIDKCIWGIFLMDRQIVPESPAPAAILGGGTEANLTTIPSCEVQMHENYEH